MEAKSVRSKAKFEGEKVEARSQTQTFSAQGKAESKEEKIEKAKIKQT